MNKIKEEIKTIDCMENDLKELRDLDSEIVWDSTSKVFSTQRKRRQEVRLDASHRLGDSEEKREEILRIVE